MKVVSSFFVSLYRFELLPLFIGKKKKRIDFVTGRKVRSLVGKSNRNVEILVQKIE